MNPFKMIKALFTSAPRLTPRDCMERVRSGEALLIDVREPDEWSEGVAELAVLLPFSDLTGSSMAWKQFLADASDRELLLYCAAGGRSAIAARMLARDGFRAANVGSLKEWAANGWPGVKPARR